MRFAFTEDQLLLQKTVRDFLRAECTPERIRALWETETARSPDALEEARRRRRCRGSSCPRRHGGMGMDEIDAVLLLRGGRPRGARRAVVATAAVGAPLLAELGGELAARWLPRVAAGAALLAVGHPDEPFVEDAHVADLLLLPARGRRAARARARRGAARRRSPRTTRRSGSSPRRFDARGRDAASARGERARALFAAAFDRGALACAARARRRRGAAARPRGRLRVAARAVRPADRLLPGGEAHARRREGEARVRAARSSTARPTPLRGATCGARSTSRWRRPRRARPPPSPRARRCRPTARSATPGSRTFTSGCGAPGRSTSRGAPGGCHRERIAGAVLAPGAEIGPGTTF